MNNYINSLFGFLELKKAPYVFLGDWNKLINGTYGDIDLSIDLNKREVFQLVKSFAVENEFRIIQMLEHEVSCWYFVLVNEDGCYLKLDICSNYVKNGSLYICSKVLAKGRFVIQCTKDLRVYVPDNKTALDYYFTKRSLKSDWDNISKDYLESLGIDVNDISSLKEMYVLKPMKRYRFQELARIFKRIKEPTGVMLGFYGPDGIGKSTITSQVQAQLEQGFRDSKIAHLFISKLENVVNNKKSVLPYAKKSYPHVLSYIKLFHFFLKYLLGWKVVSKLKVQSCLLIMDRYYHDIIADPLRYRYGGSDKASKFLAMFIPKPELSVILVADVAVIHKRKKEVSELETERQINGYKGLKQTYSNYIEIDANMNVSQIVNMICSETYKVMESRTQRRLGL